MKDVNSLLGYRYMVKHPDNVAEVGNHLEWFLGGRCNNSNEPDIAKYWEVKSHNINAKSSLRLAGQSGITVNELTDITVNKIKHLIYIEYHYISTNEIEVLRVTLFNDLNVNYFKSMVGYKIPLEKARNTLRCYAHNLPLFYGSIITIKAK